MAFLSSLPAALTDMIIEDLTFADIRSPVRTCKSLRIAATPALYRTITINFSNEVFRDAHSIGREHVKNLCCTLIRNPDLARHVRACEIRPSDLWFYEGALSAQERGLFDNAIDRSSLHPTVKTEWKTALLIHEAGNFPVILPLMLYQCVRLRRVSVPYMYLPRDSWLWRVTQSTTEPRPLRQLSNVRIVYEDPLEKRPEDHPVELFQSLPAMEVLELVFGFYGAGPTSNLQLRRVAPTVALTRTAGTLSTLSILKCDAPASELEYLLQHTPQLRQLKCEFFYPASLKRLFLEDLQTGLELIRSTLAHLVVRYDIYDNWYFPVSARHLGGIIRGDLSFLRGFPALTTLETSLALLFGEDGFRYDSTYNPTCSLAEVLPPTLRRLIITDDMWTFAPFLHTEGVMTMDIFKRFFVGQGQFDGWTLWTEPKDVVWEERGDIPWKTATPDLKEFVFDIRMRGRDSPDYWVLQDTRDELQHVCESQGIKCSILHGDLG